MDKQEKFEKLRTLIKDINSMRDLLCHMENIGYINADIGTLFTKLDDSFAELSVAANDTYTRDYPRAHSV